MTNTFFEGGGQNWGGQQIGGGGLATPGAATAWFLELLLYLQSLFSTLSSEYDFRNSEMKLNLPKPRTNYLK